MKYLNFENHLQKIEEEYESKMDSLSVQEKKKWLSKIEKAAEKDYETLTDWNIVEIARHPQRPLYIDYLNKFFTDFFEIKGDQHLAEDKAILGGLAKIEKQRVAVLGFQKGKTLQEKKEDRFGMANPEGFYKSMRIMKLAEKLKLPLITFIDTPGAYPGVGAEERGQAIAIAKCIETLVSLKTPVISIVTGEGGSGGALALSVADRLAMLTYSFYAVISPEGAASILLKDKEKAPQIVTSLKVTAPKLSKLGIVSDVIFEKKGGAHRFPQETMENVKDYILSTLTTLQNENITEILKERYQKFQNYGIYKEL